MVITVTGSTGTIGSHLVEVLAREGVPTRAILRDPAKARRLPHVVWAQADLSDASLLEPALAGTDRLFLLTGNDPGFGRIQIDVLRVAAQVGVRHVVKLSAYGASPRSNSAIGREHWEVEQALQQQSAMGWTILRPHSFMQNWLDDVAESVRAEGRIYSPIEDGRVPFIDARDIADVAAVVLKDPAPHAGKKYYLSGGEAVGYADVASAISEATGREVTYQPISMEEARARMEARGTPAPLIDATLALAAYQKAGGPTAQVSGEVERILGRPPRTIRDFARDYAEHFRPRGAGEGG
ncbi:MAG TPA: SDR family oxidoreductase [Longimicrobiales bacterium]|nr:SDR family oxidoreductase [Longimicrobiales bacterium]